MTTTRSVTKIRPENMHFRRLQCMMRRRTTVWSLQWSILRLNEKNPTIRINSNDINEIIDHNADVTIRRISENVTIKQRTCETTIRWEIERKIKIKHVESLSICMQHHNASETSVNQHYFHCQRYLFHNNLHESETKIIPYRIKIHYRYKPSQQLRIGWQAIHYSPGKYRQLWK